MKSVFEYRDYREYMRDFYEKLTLDEDASIVECAPEICRRLDALLVGKLWKKKKE